MALDPGTKVKLARDGVWIFDEGFRYALNCRWEAFDYRSALEHPLVGVAEARIPPDNWDCPCVLSTDRIHVPILNPRGQAAEETPIRLAGHEAGLDMQIEKRRLQAPLGVVGTVRGPAVGSGDSASPKVRADASVTVKDGDYQN